MKILHCITSIDPKTGGTAEATVKLSVEMERLGHSNDILTLDPPEALLPDASVNIPIIQKGPGKLGSFNYSNAFRDWLNRNISNYDAVIIHGLWQYTGFASAATCRKYQVPYFVFTHGMLDPWFNRVYPIKKLKKYLYWPWGEYRVLRGAKAVLFTCEEERRLAAQSFRPYHAKEMVVGLGTSSPDQTTDELKHTFDHNRPEWGQRPYFLFMGRIQEKKGLHLLIDAYSNLRRTRPEMPDLVIAGPIQQIAYADRLKNGYRQEGIHWVGNLSGSIKWQALANAEAMVLISHQENFGIVVAESLSVGVPVIISDKVNIYREIQSDGAGLVCEDNIEGAQLILRDWLDSAPSVRDKARAAAYPCFEKHFEIKTASERLVDLIDRCGEK